MKKNRPIVAIASFGGHWIQLNEVVANLKIDSELILITTSILFKKDTKKIFIVADCNKNQPVKAMICFLQLLKLFLKERPKLVLSTGATPGFLAIIIAKFFNAKTIWVDSIANVTNISLSGRLSRPFCDYTFTQWKHLETKKTKYIGSLL